MNIGFIGIGQMGSRMAKRLLAAGYDLTINDVNKGASADLLAKGARWVGTPKEMAESCSTVISMLPGPAEVELIVYGPKGLMAGWKKDDVYIDMSTSLPTMTQRVAKDAAPKGVAVLDAPVTGGITGAEAGSLTIFVGGDGAAFKKVRGILEKLGKAIIHMGGVGCGNTTKLVNNLIAITCSTINGEAFVLGVKAGIDARKLWEAVTAGSGNNRALQEFWPNTVFKGNFEPGFQLNLALKDISLAMALAGEYGLSLPVTAAVEQRVLEAKHAGLGEKNSHATILLLEKLSGVKVRFSP